MEKRLAGSAPKSGRGNESEITKEMARKLSIAELAELERTNPEKFKTLFD